MSLLCLALSSDLLTMCRRGSDGSKVHLNLLPRHVEREDWKEDPKIFTDFRLDGAAPHAESVEIPVEAPCTNVVL
eukprot:CAMPEP_0194768268 /NCGR_PEP_ID=MMETSP0323_2-20130528/39051_1 /TAXON_ID=2866 ORGANISM="Crypthecodinium cohnii, Strain Seligo" /NCGR_SAMPLE_ID=MMETSP0323_2 /ASSEMBLY_ACC=CAM_ASM_000346 /LENGTH=74 /DNA_ID=CAMNT_0039700583 /DNA_START=161 /DNA_END=381 /DNA_ORIENTATION=-